MFRRAVWIGVQLDLNLLMDIYKIALDDDLLYSYSWTWLPCPRTDAEENLRVAGPDVLIRLVIVGVI